MRRVACALLGMLVLTAYAVSAQEERPLRPAGPVPVYGYEVVNAWPHDPTAYTQGLLYHDGGLYEGTGRHGASGVRIVELHTGKVMRRVDIAAEYFGEGIAILGGKVFQLTWQSRKGFIYEQGSLKRLGEFSYEGEGWGLTTDGESLIMSDGTARLRFLDPATFRVRRSVDVHEHGKPLAHLNELEYIKGEVYANVWRRDAIVRIDPRTGDVRGWIDLTGLAAVPHPDAVLNGIAYDPQRDRIFVTGKLWPRIFEIRLKQRRP